MNKRLQFVDNNILMMRFMVDWFLALCFTILCFKSNRLLILGEIEHQWVLGFRV